MRNLLIVLAVLTFAGCVNWADRNARVSFVPQLLRQIEQAPVRPIQLGDAQRRELFSSLSGPVKQEFLAKDLKPEVFASWFEEDRRAVTLVRYSQDGARFAFIAYGPDGKVFAMGGGQIRVDPPWEK